MAEILHNFGKLLRQARSRARLSRIALAERAGFNPSYIHRLETCTRKPSRAAVQVLADVLRVDRNELGAWFTAAGFVPAPTVPSPAASRTRSALHGVRSTAGMPVFHLADRWLEGVGLKEESVDRLLRGMEVAKIADRRHVSRSVSSVISYLGDMLTAPVRTAVIPAASGNLMLARHAIQRLLLRAIREASSARISKIILVIAPGTEQYFYTPLKEALDLAIAPKLAFKYSIQLQPDGLGDAILHAEKFVENEAFAVLLPDELIDKRAATLERPGELRSMMNAFSELSVGNLVAVKPIPKSKMQRYGVVRVGPEVAPRVFHVDELVEKPTPGNPISQAENAFGIVGRYVLRPEIFHALRELKSRGDQPLQLTSALELIRQRSQRIYAYDLKAERQDIGEVLGKANDLLEVPPLEMDV
jgi:UTP--glucose-1-phosphate uridylyltransferase